MNDLEKAEQALNEQERAAWSFTSTGRGYRAIADALNISDSAAKNTARRAILKLAAALPYDRDRPFADQLIDRILTTVESTRLAYRLRGWGWDHLARELGASNTSIRNSVKNAERKILDHADELLKLAIIDERLGVAESWWERRTSARRKLKDVIDRDGERCYLCGITLTIDEAELEHIVPRSLGGTNDQTNLAVACRPCNTTKAANVVSFRVSDRRPVYHQCAA